MKTNLEKIILEPIGILSSDKKYRYETPRQAVLASENLAVIELLPGKNFEQALEDLNGFERIWVIYQFHLNNNWKPKVNPPFHSPQKKIGLFATRAPYRPNPIGISCVRLIKTEGLKIYISESDILDGSPIIDIKPYLPYSDSFPESKTGWVNSPDGTTDNYIISYDKKALEQIKWLFDNGGFNLEDFIRLQLSSDPCNSSRKRIVSLDKDLAANKFVLAYRTWRIYYHVLFESSSVLINLVKSGYTEEELKNKEDKYKDKTLHRAFQEIFYPADKSSG